MSERQSVVESEAKSMSIASVGISWEDGWDGGGLVPWPNFEQIVIGKGKKEEVVVVPWESGDILMPYPYGMPPKRKHSSRLMNALWGSFCCCSNCCCCCRRDSSDIRNVCCQKKNLRILILLSLIGIAVVIVIILIFALPDKTNGNAPSISLSSQGNNNKNNSNNNDDYDHYASEVPSPAPFPPFFTASPAMTSSSQSSHSSLDTTESPSLTPKTTISQVPSLSSVPFTTPSIYPSSILSTSPPTGKIPDTPKNPINNFSTPIPSSSSSSSLPSWFPTENPSTLLLPTPTPSKLTSASPSKLSSVMPTLTPTTQKYPSAMPTLSQPSKLPSYIPILIPSFVPTQSPSPTPSSKQQPTIHPTKTTTTTTTTTTTNFPSSSSPTPHPTTSQPTTLSPSSSPTTSLLTFYVVSGRLGDISDTEIRQNLQSLLPTTITSSSSSSPTPKETCLIHLGDFLNREIYPDCSYTPYEKTHNQFLSSPFPVYFIPGDNEWTDCPNPDLAWIYWINTFGQYAETNANLWSFPTTTKTTTKTTTTTTTTTPMVLRQSVRRENFAFSIRSILHIGLNMVGGTAEEDKSLTQQRIRDNIDWFRQSISHHLTTSSSSLDLVLMYGNASPNNKNQDFFNALGDHYLGRNGISTELSQRTTFVYMHKTSKNDDWSVTKNNALGITGLVIVKVKSVWPPMKVEVNLSSLTLNLDQGDWIL